MRQRIWGLAGFWLALSIGNAATLAVWDFTKGPAGWRDEAGSPSRTTAEGTHWPGTAQGISLRSPTFQIPAQAFQLIEITLRMRGKAPLHLLWQGENRMGTAGGWHGVLPVEPPADGLFHTLRLLPLWQNLRTITALRLLGPPGVEITLAQVQIVGPDMPPVTQERWQFEQAAEARQWLALLGTAELRQQAEGLWIRPLEGDVAIVSPPLAIPSYRFEWLSLELTARQEIEARLLWATTAQRGWHGPTLQLRPGRHIYNVHCGAEASWNGELTGLALMLQKTGSDLAPAASGGEIVWHSLVLSNRPQGPPELRSLFAGPLEPVIRPERAFRFIWAIQNEGGTTARRVLVRVSADETISIPGDTVVIDELPHGMPEPFTWLAKARAPGVIRLRAEYGDRVLEEAVRIEPQPAPPQEKEGYVPAPAQQAPYPVLAHLHEPPPATFFPLALDRLLFRRPYLGDYALQPEVVDWQIKWALEHGIAGFLVDVGATEKAALDAFLSAHFSARALFCFYWTEPAPTEEAAEALLDQLAPVLSLPNYVRWQGRPLIFVAKALQTRHEGWGLCDLHSLAAQQKAAFIACVPLGMATRELLARAGYAAVADLHTEEKAGNVAPLIETWESAAEQHVPHLLSLQPAWREMITPERLELLLRIALLRTQRPNSSALPIVIVGDWNGEKGIEPRRGEGTRWLEAVAHATGMTPTPLLLPLDMGLGPYDRPLRRPPDAWEFETKETWTSAMGMSVLKILDGQLTGYTDSDQPALFGGETMLDTRHYHTALIGLAVSTGKQGRLWWRTSLRKFTIEHSLPFALIPDGAVHEYRLDLSKAPGWEGYLLELRLDPTDTAGAAIAVDYIRLLP